MSYRSNIDHLHYGLLASSLALAVIEANSRPSRVQAQTNAVEPEPAPPQPESRQVRRARERREAKAARRFA